VPPGPNTQTDDTGWPAGAPAPWLAQYGAAPIDASLAPSAPTPDAAPQSVVDSAATSPAVGALSAMAPVPTPTSADASQRSPAPDATQVPPNASPQPNAAPAAPTDGSTPFEPAYLAPHAAVPFDAALAGSPGEAAAQVDHTLVNAASNPDVPIANRQQAWQQLTPEQRTNTVNNADPKQLAALATSAMSPEELATISIRHEAARIHEQTAAQLAIAQQTEATARQNFQGYQASVAKANTDTDDVDRQAQAISREQVDPGEHGVGNFIASVLLGAAGGFASSATGGRNLALEAMQKQNDQRIQAQKDAIANQWQGVNVKRNVIQEQLARSGDLYKAQEIYRVSQYDRATAALQTQMQDYDPRGTTAIRIAGSIQQIGAARQQALQAFNQQQLKNHLDVWKAQTEADTLKAKVWNDQQVNSLGWANYSRENADAKAKNAIAQGELDEKKAQRLATAGQAQQEKDIKEIVNDPATGAPLLAPEGQTMMAQAKQLDTQASAATDPTQQQALAQQAQQLRTQAVTQHAVRRGDPAEHKTLQNQLDASQNFTNAAERVKQLLASDPSSFDRGTFAKATTAYEEAKQQYILTLPDSKVTSREMEATSKTLAGDPGSFMSRVAGRNKLIASLDELEQGVGSNVATALRGAGQQAPKGGAVWTPKITHVEAVEPLSGKTSIEAGQDAQPSNIVSKAFYPLGGAPDTAGAAENSSAFGPTGLSKDDTATVQTQIARFTSAKDPEQREKAAHTLAAYATSPREPIANGVIALVRANPDAYREVLAKLPPDRRAEIETQTTPGFDATPPLSGAALHAAIQQLTPEQRARLQQILAAHAAQGAQ
jgi:hypothetical protein